MTLGIPLRGDFDSLALRSLAKTTKDAAQARRLLALAEIYDGHSFAHRPYPSSPPEPKCIRSPACVHANHRKSICYKTMIKPRRQ
jgi:hypothetical protein